MSNGLDPRRTSATAPTVDAEGLRQRLDDPDLLILDVRPLRAYNGWRLSDEVRGGHIPGAVACPVAWLDRLDRPGAERLLDEKGISAPRSIVLVGSGADDVGRLLPTLRDRGITDVTVLGGGFRTWAAVPDLPVDRLPRYEALVHADWLADVLAGGRPEAAPLGPFRLFHVDFGGPGEYEEGHIPGALHLDTEWLEDPSDWNRRSPRELEDVLRGLGVTRDTTVVLYGRDSEGAASEAWPGRRAGQSAATRALMILRYAGVDDVRSLDGGYDAWVGAGHPLETTRREPDPVPAFGAPVPVRPEVIVDIDEVKRMIADPAGAALVSVRAWQEHIGAVSGYGYIDPVGRIKGDVWGGGGTDAGHMEDFRNADGTMRPYPEIAARWADAGISPDKRVAFYCGTGWRASEAWFAAYLQGWPRIAVYDGGWFEWSRDPLGNPVEVGPP